MGNESFISHGGMVRRTLATTSIFNKSTSNLGNCVLDGGFTTLITSASYGKQFPKSRFNDLIQQLLKINNNYYRLSIQLNDYH